MAPRKILIIDDSAVMREFLCSALGAIDGFEALGAAGNADIAYRKAERVRPDVVLLNLALTATDSLSLIRRFGRIQDLPVIAYFDPATQDTDRTNRAIQLGALETFAVPPLSSAVDVERFIAHVQEMLRAVPKRRKSAIAITAVQTSKTPPPSADKQVEVKPPPFASTLKVVAIGTSTGGTEALGEVLSKLPEDSPPIVAVIHMPPGYTNSYAQRLDRECAVHVAEAADGDEVLPGNVLIAPGDFHMEVLKRNGKLTVRIAPGDKVSGFRPSVDVLFQSCARSLEKHGIGVLLTGMGRDGAQGLLAMRNAGAHTIAQDEATSTIFGMPKEAIQLDAACQVLPLGLIAGQILKHSRQSPRHATTVSGQS